MPAIPPLQGFLYAACLGLMLPAAGFFPVLCGAVIRRRVRGATILAAVCGIVAITCAAVLSRVIHGLTLVAAAYLALCLIGLVLYAVLRHRLPAFPANRPMRPRRLMPPRTGGGRNGR